MENRANIALMISKCDMLDDELQTEMKAQLDQDFKGMEYMMISSISQQNLQQLKDKLWKMLNQ